MNDKISISKDPDDRGNDHQSIKSWVEEFSKRTGNTSQEPPATEEKTQNKDESPDIDRVFSQLSDRTNQDNDFSPLFSIMTVFFIIYMTFLVFSTIHDAFNDSIFHDSNYINHESESSSISNNKEPVAHLTSKKENIDNGIEKSEPIINYKFNDFIEGEIEKINLEDEIYVSRNLSELNLNNKSMDALMSCDYLEFYAKTASFKESYRIKMSCYTPNSTNHFTSEHNYGRYNETLEISGYIKNGHITLSHNDSVILAKMLGYENLINYESKTEIQAGYIKWLSKAAIEWRSKT